MTPAISRTPCPPTPSSAIFVLTPARSRLAHRVLEADLALGDPQLELRRQALHDRQLALRLGALGLLRVGRRTDRCGLRVLDGPRRHRLGVGTRRAADEVAPLGRRLRLLGVQLRLRLRCGSAPVAESSTSPGATGASAGALAPVRSHSGISRPGLGERLRQGDLARRDPHLDLGRELRHERGALLRLGAPARLLVVDRCGPLDDRRGRLGRRRAALAGRLGGRRHRSRPAGPAAPRARCASACRCRCWRA